VLVGTGRDQLAGRDDRPAMVRHEDTDGDFALKPSRDVIVQRSRACHHASNDWARLQMHEDVAAGGDNDSVITAHAVLRGHSPRRGHCCTRIANRHRPHDAKPGRWLPV
jgi:hypothetical protein